MLRGMRLVIREIHAARQPDQLNDEWFVVENSGELPFSTAGCTVSVGKGAGKGRLRAIGTLDPGFTLQPGERVRVVTGNPAKKAHGTVPEAGPGEGAPRNYHLFLATRLLQGSGSVIALSLHQHEVARGVFDAASATGVNEATQPGDA